MIILNHYDLDDTSKPSRLNSDKKKAQFMVTEIDPLTKCYMIYLTFYI